MTTDRDLPVGETADRHERLANAVGILLPSSSDGPKRSTSRLAMDRAAAVLNRALEEGWDLKEIGHGAAAAIDKPELARYQHDLIRLAAADGTADLRPLVERAFDSLARRGSPRERWRTIRRLIYLSEAGALVPAEIERLVDQLLTTTGKVPDGIPRIFGRAMARGDWAEVALPRWLEPPHGESRRMAHRVLLEAAQHGMNMESARSFLEHDKATATLLFHELCHGSLEAVVESAHKNMNVATAQQIEKLVPAAGPERCIAALSEFLAGDDPHLRLEACNGLAALARAGQDIADTVDRLETASRDTRYVQVAHSTVSKHAVQALAYLAVFTPKHREQIQAQLDRLAAIDDREAACRLAAAGGLTLIHAANADRPSIEKLLTSRNKKIRREVCLKLSRAAELGIDTNFIEPVLLQLHEEGGNGAILAVNEALRSLQELRQKNTVKIN